MLLNGVRMATAETPTGMISKIRKEPSMAVSLRESVHQVADPSNLDASVEEVFQLMLGVECRNDPGGPSDSRLRQDPRAGEHEEESVTAVVGFGGLLSGACVFSSGRAVALEIAARMTGMEFGEVDDTVKDGLGEICNMLAGAWKGKVPELAANCGLSVPAVITGRDYKLHVQAPEFQLHHHYRFGDSRFSVMIVCDGLQ
jgi:chemotaxis protein CheX